MRIKDTQCTWTITILACRCIKKLEDRGIGPCGTVKPNRKIMPECLKPRNLALQKGDDPVFYRSDNLIACSWHDTNRVTFLSTVDTTILLTDK